MAEGIEKVPGAKNFETMIQNPGRYRINVASSPAYKNDSCTKSVGSDFFNTLGCKQTLRPRRKYVCFAPNSRLGSALRAQVFGGGILGRQLFLLRSKSGYALVRQRRRGCPRHPSAPAARIPRRCPHRARAGHRQGTVARHRAEHCGGHERGQAAHGPVQRRHAFMGRLARPATELRILGRLRAVEGPNRRHLCRTFAVRRANSR